MSDFNRAVWLVLDAEGVKLLPGKLALDTSLPNPRGYVNDPRDPGGETAFGLSKAANPDLDMTTLTLEQAVTRYRERYWSPYGLDHEADPWAYFLFDSYVQHGPTVVKGWHTQFNRLSDAVWNRVRYYATLKNFDTFGRGWMRRMANLRDALGREYGVWS